MPCGPVVRWRKTRKRIQNMTFVARLCGLLLCCSALAHAQHTRQYHPISANPVVFALEVPSTSVISTITTWNNTIVSCPPESKSEYEALLPPLSGLSIVFGYTFSLLTAMQFLPQIWTISVRRSIYGLSLLSLALECVSAASNFWNLCILNWFALTSCSVVGLGTCMPYVQPVVQGAALWIVLSVLYGIALHTFANHDMDPMRTDADKDTEFDSHAWLFGLPRRKAIELLICAAVCLTCSALSIFCLVSYGPCNQFTEWVARTQGLINSALTVIQWWPQIIMSIQIQERGTLSSLTLIGVLITDIFTIAYLTYMRQDWTAWLSNVMNCAMVICLLAILTYLELDGRGRRRATSTSLAPAAEIPMQVTVRPEQSGLLKSNSRLDSSFDDDEDDELGSHALKLKSFR